MHARATNIAHPRPTGHLWKGLVLAGALGLVLAIVCQGETQGPQFIQYGFENREPIFSQGPADAKFEEVAHELTTKSFNTGRSSEKIELKAEKGTYIHYVYPVGRAPITEELNVGLWLSANRPGVQLFCRVVLPRERDPANLDRPMTLLVPGDKYKYVKRWQQLRLRRPDKRLREQQQLVNAERKTNLVITDAYVDQIVLNLYAGPGLTTAHIDDLEVGPVFSDASVASTPKPIPTPGHSDPKPQVVRRRDEQVQLKGSPAQLLVKGEKFFLRGIRHSGTPLKVLQEAGFNTLWIDENASPQLVNNALDVGMWLVPSLTSPNIVKGPGAPGDLANDRGTPAQLTSRAITGRKVSRFLDQGGILCWDLGSNLVREQARTVFTTSRTIQRDDPLRPISVNVWDGFEHYSRNIDNLMLGVHRWPLMTGLELTAYRDWLVGHRRLAQPGTYTWSWVQTHVPDWFMKLGYDGEKLNPELESLGPQPEQIRLLAYTAIGAGCRGLGFWSDRSLADSHTGRDRLLALAQLNHELYMLEPLLVEAEEPFWISTNKKDVQAAVLRTKKALLVIPIWMGKGAQFVPGQASETKVKIRVPQVPPSWQPWQVTTGKVNSLRWTRYPGGKEVTLDNFGLTSAIVFTSDLGVDGVIVRFQSLQRRLRGAAAQWSYHQARESLAKVEKVQTQLEAMGKTPNDARELLEKARQSVALASQLRNDFKYEESYEESQRALQPLRILMRSHWERATAVLTSPTASPYAVSFYTLPRHWRFLNEVAQSQVTSNALAGGDFELPPKRVPPGWMIQESPSLDEVEATAKRVTTSPRRGKQCLHLKVYPKSNETRPEVLERTFLALHSPAVKLPPGSLVRISAWIRIPAWTKGSPDGALFYDSAGGEPLAVRVRGLMPWKKFVMYRRVPAEGKISVTMALTAIGDVYFDDVRIEPLSTATAKDIGPAVPPTPPVPSRPGAFEARRISGSIQN